MSVLFAVLAILAAFLGSLLFGIIGGVAAIVFALLAILFAIKHRKKVGSGGIGSIVFAVIALIVGITLGCIAVPMVADQAETYAKDHGYTEVAKYAPTFRYGAIGIAVKLSEDGVDINKFTEDFNKVFEELNKSNTNK